MTGREGVMAGMARLAGIPYGELLSRSQLDGLSTRSNSAKLVAEMLASRYIELSKLTGTDLTTLGFRFPQSKANGDCDQTNPLFTIEKRIDDFAGRRVALDEPALFERIEGCAYVPVYKARGVSAEDWYLLPPLIAARGLLEELRQQFETDLAVMCDSVAHGVAQAAAGQDLASIEYDTPAPGHLLQIRQHDSQKPDGTYHPMQSPAHGGLTVADRTYGVYLTRDFFGALAAASASYPFLPVATSRRASASPSPTFPSPERPAGKRIHVGAQRRRDLEKRRRITSEYDYDLLAGACDEHEMTVQALSRALEELGLEPLDSNIDCYVAGHRHVVLFEVKSIRGANLRKQTRLAIGQLHDYRHFLMPAEAPFDAPVTLAVVFSHDPGEEIRGFLAAIGFGCAWRDANGMAMAPNLTGILEQMRT
jgi:hypothetical protein